MTYKNIAYFKYSRYWRFRLLFIDDRGYKVTITGDNFKTKTDAKNAAEKKRAEFL